VTNYDSQMFWAVRLISCTFCWSNFDCQLRVVPKCTGLSAGLLSQVYVA